MLEEIFAPHARYLPRPAWHSLLMLATHHLGSYLAKDVIWLYEDEDERQYEGTIRSLGAARAAMTQPVDCAYSRSRLFS